MYIRFEAVQGCPDARSRFPVFDSRMHDVSCHIAENEFGRVGVPPYSTRNVPFIVGWYVQM
jgi:hypothetical protein